MKKSIIKLATVGIMSTLLFIGCGGSAGKGGSSFNNSEYGLSAPQFEIRYPGSEVLVDYAKYGKFEGLGTKDYKYVVTDKRGLLAASGTGVWPNTGAVDYEPEYKRLLKAGKIILGTGTSELPWKSSEEANKAIPFFQWQKNSYSPGTKMLNMGNALRDAGHIIHAIKTYYAHVVFFPGDMAWDPKGWWWSTALASAGALEELIAKYPEMGIEYTGAKINVRYSNDTDLSNDEVYADPGELIGELVGKPITNGAFVDPRDRHKRDMAIISKPISIAKPGTEFPVDFTKYGTIENGKGKGAYKYTVKDAKVLSGVVGEGIYPNEMDVKNSPQYTELKMSGWMIGHWDAMYYESSTLNYYSFASEGEDPGAKLYFIGDALMQDALNTKNEATAKHAITAFQALINIFPGAMVSGDATGKWFWAAGPVAIGNIKKLTKNFPGLGVELAESEIIIENGPDVDQDRTNDIVKAKIGKLVKK